MLQNLDVKKASGPDELPCRLLKELANELALIYTDIFQCSLDTGELPSAWKTTNVAPIYIKVPVCEAENYCPVSLTCVPCKLLEHILCSHIHAHLDSHQALTPLNHSFRAKHSCETQLLITMQHLLTKCDPVRAQTDVAVLDFSKAFDKVPHGGLMNKLRLLGIEGNIAQWIQAFLSWRTQRVSVDREMSGSADVLSGVPPGTILGPLLFLCYINDLPSVVSPGTKIRLFADDCLAYRAIHSIEDLLQLQEDLTNLSNWGMQWGMRFNTSKCNIMTISNSATPLTKFYEIDNRILQHVDVATYLGVIINRSLDFSDHIRETVSKANKKFGFLKRNLKGSPSALRRTAYHSLIRSGLEYGATIWDPHLDTQKKAIERVQNQAIRWIYDLRPREECSITQLRKDLGLQTLEERRLQQRLALLYKIIIREVAITTEDLCITSADGRTRASHRHKFKEKWARTNRLKYSTVHHSIPTWNRLPANVAEAGSIDTFKSRLSALRP